MFNCRRLIAAYLIFCVMFTALIIGLALSAIGIGVNAAMQSVTNASNQSAMDAANAANLKSVEETNATNYANVMATNQANAEQAELAYKRSLPSNQVANMVAAGMSRNSALSALTGGGSYTAPVMQSAVANAGQVTPFQKAFNGLDFDSLADKIMSAPANVMQSKLLKSQLQAANQQYDLNIADEMRKQQVHELDVWQRLYGKETATKLDAAANLINNTLLDHGKDISEYSNYEDMIRQLGLSSNPIVRDIPYLARTQLEDSVRQKFAEHRAQQQQQNSNVAASDSHKLSEIQRKKLRAELEDFNAAKDTRQKEYAARSMRAQIEALADERGISKQEMYNSLQAYRDKDGNLHEKPENKIAPIMQKFWSDIFEIIPIGSLSDVFFRGLKFGK